MKIQEDQTFMDRGSVDPEKLNFKLKQILPLLKFKINEKTILFKLKKSIAGGRNVELEMQIICTPLLKKVLGKGIIYCKTFYHATSGGSRQLKGYTDALARFFIST